MAEFSFQVTTESLRTRQCLLLIIPFICSTQKTIALSIRTYFRRGLPHNCVTRVSRQQISHNKMVDMRIMLPQLEDILIIQRTVQRKCVCHGANSTKSMLDNMRQLPFRYCERERITCRHLTTVEDPIKNLLGTVLINPLAPELFFFLNFSTPCI